MQSVKPLILPAGAVVIMALVALPTAQAGGSTFIVTRTDDPLPFACEVDDCSLREAVIAANETPGENVVQLGAETYVLSIASVGNPDADAATGDIEIRDTLTIRGAEVSGAGGAPGPLTTIDAGGVDRALEVITDSGEFTAELTGLRIIGGVSTSTGGGVLVNGGFSTSSVHLTISDTVIEGNQAHSGGGIAITDGPSLDSTLTGLRITVRNNSATLMGGGAYLAAETTLEESEVRANEVDAHGGGIFATASVPRGERRAVGHCMTTSAISSASAALTSIHGRAPASNTWGRLIMQRAVWMQYCGSQVTTILSFAYSRSTPGRFRASASSTIAA